MKSPLPSDWRRALDTRALESVSSFVDAEREKHVVYPPEDRVFACFRLTPLESVRVLLLGQDPYHGPGQAEGLAFSVADGTPPPPSLRNIFKELEQDLGVPRPRSGSLVSWAQQGVLLLNAVLTVRAGEANSHANHGWEDFTDEVIRTVSAQAAPTVFLLWGRYAQKKARLVDGTRHAILEGVHPSPLSARHGFFGSAPFSRTNAALEERGRPPVDWALPAHAAKAPHS